MPETETLISELQRRIGTLEDAARRKTKDKWDIAQVVASFLSSVVIAALGWYFTRSFQQEQEHNHLTQVLAEIESSRERSDTEIRARMFEALINRFFQGDVPKGRKLVLLSLFQTNFQEFFDAGPLFAMVRKEIDDPKDREAMIKFARVVADRQELLLGAGKVDSQSFTFDEWHDVQVGKHGEHSFRVRVSLDTENPKDGVNVVIEQATGKEDLDFKTLDFNVDYFDLPFTDNTKLPDGHRFAVTLKSVDPQKRVATLKIFEFHPDFLGSRERPAFQNLKWRLSRLFDPKKCDKHVEADGCESKK